jgi:hypothetical protein
VADDSKIITEKVDKEYRRFFYDDFSMGLLKRLTRERSRDDKVSCLFIAHILISLLNIVP